MSERKWNVKERSERMRNSWLFFFALCFFYNFGNSFQISLPFSTSSAKISFFHTIGESKGRIFNKYPTAMNRFNGNSNHEFPLGDSIETGIKVSPSSPSVSTNSFVALNSNEAKKSESSKVFEWNTPTILTIGRTIAIPFFLYSFIQRKVSLLNVFFKISINLL